jgi:hypothetical protein
MRPGLLFYFIGIIFLSGCSKGTSSNNDDEADYIKATINGSLWQATTISVQTTNTPTGPQPFYIYGNKTSSSEAIRLKTAITDAGNYPFRDNQINPATILNFTVEYFESTHLLKWNTGTESSISNFGIERADDGGGYVNIGYINPAGSNSNYQFEAPSSNTFPGIGYNYRLQINESNGTFTYSSVQHINNIFTANFQPYGNFERRGYDGELVISSNDKNKKIIQGTFHFKVKTPNGTLYTLLNGEFRAHY